MAKKNEPNGSSNIIKFPGSDKQTGTRLIEIDGVVEVPISVTQEQFEDAFEKFIESNQWYFGGGIEDVTDE